MRRLLLVVLLASCLDASLGGYHSSDSVELSSIQVLTLYNGKKTNGRRSSPVPQLKCVGGTAGCRAFTPQVVQCYNRGSDGNDIQWECKTDMDNAYRFGEISVSCEGYSYPDDPYILKGSCGLEYTLDLTKEGFETKRSAGHDYYGNDYSRNNKDSNAHVKESKGSFIETVILLATVGLVIYALYRTCIAPAVEQLYQSSTTSDDFGGYPGGDPYHSSSAPPPPPGFRSDFAPGTGPSSGASCGGQQTGFGSNRGARTGAGGFWTGAATGGLLGYMFGNRNNAGTSQRYSTRENVYSDNANWGGTTRRSSGPSFSGGSSSTGTRTASGFGGTTRR